MTSLWPTSVTTEIAFTTAPLASPTWTDVSEYVRSFSVNRGRQHELDRFEAGTATLVLENLDRRFEPGYASGAYYPNVQPMKRLRIRATYSATTYDVFEGFIERWPLEYPGSGGKDAVVSVTAVDATAFLSILKFPSYPELVVEAGADAFYRLGDGTPYADATGNHADATDAPSATGITTSTTGLLPSETDDGATSFGSGSNDYIVAPDSVAIIGTENFTIEAIVSTTSKPGVDGNQRVYTQNTNNGGSGWDSVYVGLNTSGTLRFHTNDGTTASEVSGTSDLADGNPHHIMCVRSGGFMSIIVDGSIETVAARTTRDLGSLVSSVEISSQAQPWNGTIDEFAIYPGGSDVATAASHARAAGTLARAAEGSGARIAAVLDDIGWPAGERNLDTGARTVQSYILNSQTPRDHIADVAVTERGLFYIAADGNMTFVDSTALAAQTSAGIWSDTVASSSGNYNDGNYNDGNYADDGGHPYEDIVMSYDVDRLRNDVRVAIRGAGTQIAADATSIAAYGRRTYTADTHHNAPADALTDAQGILADYKDPDLRVERIVVNPGVGDKWAEVLGRELGDVITVERTPPGGGTAISEVVRIGAIGHQATTDTGWRTTWQLEPT